MITCLQASWNVADDANIFHCLQTVRKRTRSTAGTRASIQGWMSLGSPAHKSASMTAPLAGNALPAASLAWALDFIAPGSALHLTNVNTSLSSEREKEDDGVIRNQRHRYHEC